VLLASCGAAAAPVDLQSTELGPSKVGVLAQCDRSLHVRHVTFHDGETGIDYSGGGSSHILESSIFTGFSVEAISCGAVGFASLGDMLEFDNDSPGCLSGTAGLLSVDPLFVFPTAGDYRLCAGSPAVDSASDPGLDLNGPGPDTFYGAAPDRGGLESR
jgi:hypothetical protein